MLYCECETASLLLVKFVCLPSAQVLYIGSANGTLKSKTHAKTADAYLYLPSTLFL